jgi:hypothetical protein
MSHLLHSLARAIPKTRSPHDRVAPDYVGDAGVWVYNASCPVDVALDFAGRKAERNHCHTCLTETPMLLANTING